MEPENTSVQCASAGGGEPRTLIRLCDVAAVKEDEPVPVCPDRMQPVAVYRIEDAFYVTDNTCTHADAALTDGFQEGTVINCPLHGGSFDITTGQPLTSPCRKALQCHRVTVKDGAIFIEVPDA